ncbi:MAG: hypothetical protein E6J53_06005 [Chloroflexi bacterium]|nr:MAG: hypothetical protein E6J53_06005 [Chloroflexota bacterium]
MGRPNSPANRKARTPQPNEPAAALVDAWWTGVLAGEADEPHPVYGERVKARLKDGRIVMSGEVDSRRDREALIAQAKQKTGHEVDASALAVVVRRERRGVLDQTLMAAFPEPEVAELARDLVTQHAQVTPKAQAIIRAGEQHRLRGLLPEEFLIDAERVLRKNQALLILRVDETDALDVRRLLEEDTRSTWTVATPPHLAEKATE